MTKYYIEREHYEAIAGGHEHRVIEPVGDGYPTFKAAADAFMSLAVSLWKSVKVDRYDKSRMPMLSIYDGDDSYIVVDSDVKPQRREYYF